MCIYGKKIYPRVVLHSKARCFVGNDGDFPRAKFDRFSLLLATRFPGAFSINEQPTGSNNPHLTILLFLVWEKSRAVGKTGTFPIGISRPTPRHMVTYNSRHKRWKRKSVTHPLSLPHCFCNARFHSRLWAHEAGLRQGEGCSNEDRWTFHAGTPV